MRAAGRRGVHGRRRRETGILAALGSVGDADDNAVVEAWSTASGGTRP